MTADILPCLHFVLYHSQMVSHAEGEFACSANISDGFPWKPNCSVGILWKLFMVWIMLYLIKNLIIDVLIIFKLKYLIAVRNMFYPYNL